MKNGEKETAIQSAILKYLQYQNIHAWRMNTTGTPIGNTGRFRANQNAGMADIYCQMIVSGRPVPVWLEVKTSKGRQSPKQKQFEETINEVGGFYYLVRSVDDVQDALKDVIKRLK